MGSSIGERIKVRRKEMGLTLTQLSEKCGISPQLISDYENNRKEPGVKNIRLLCNALSVYPNYFFLENDYESSCGKKNTYGFVMDCYSQALDYSKKDELVIDENSREVLIKIKDPVLINFFVALKACFYSDTDMARSAKKAIINMAYCEQIKVEEK